MSANLEQGPLKEAAILTRAVENVFRKLIRLLIGRMTLTKLQEMIRIIFVEEAEANLRAEQLGENVSLSRLGVVTGLDTRTLKKTRRVIAESTELANENFLDGFNPLLRVYDLWMNDARYFDSKTEQPRTLAIKGESNNFSQLVSETMPSRGITVKAVLQRLDKRQMVIVDELNNTVQLVRRDSEFITKDELEMFGVGMDATSDLLGTVTHNIENRKNEEYRFFQREFWNYQLSREKISELRKVIHSFLETADNDGRKLISSLAEKEVGVNQLTAGVGMYYFESSNDKK